MSKRRPNKDGVGVNRREFLVTIAGAVLGNFVLPRLPSADTRPIGYAPVLPRDLLTIPDKFSISDDPEAPFELMWTEMLSDGMPEVMFWVPSTPEEIAEAEAFYNAARDFDPDSQQGLRGVANRVVARVSGWTSRVHRSPEEERLLAAIRADLEAIEPRRQYADFLIAKGDPQGELIKLACDWLTLPDSDPMLDEARERYEELLDEHGEQWLAPIIKAGVNLKIYGRVMPTYFYNRGFIEDLTIQKPVILPEYADAIFDAAPILHKIVYTHSKLDVVQFISSPRMSQLQTIDLTEVRMDREGLAAIAGSENLASLRDLSLRELDLTGEGAVPMVTSPVFDRLKKLKLMSCWFDADSAKTLFGSPALSGLECLDLAGTRIGKAGAIALATSPYITNLRSLNVQFGEFGDAGFEAIANSPALARLEKLHVGHCELTARSFLELANSRYLTNLTALDMSSQGGKIDSSSIQALVESKVVRNLRSLNLFSVLDDARGAIALAESPALSNLEELDVGYCDIGPEGVARLALSKNLSRLKILKLFKTKAGLEGARALVNSPMAEQFESISLDDSDICPKAREILKKRFPPEVLPLWD